MCSIVGSFDKDKIYELVKLNAYRGQYAHSVSLIDIDKMKFREDLYTKALGPINIINLEIPEDHYCIVHHQAPTTKDKGLDYIHPAIQDNFYLWHNGILKEQTIKDLQKIFERNDSWDTSLLLQAVISDPESLNDIDGSFSNIMIQDKTALYVWRNEIAPLFADRDFTISSTKFGGSKALEPNTIFGVTFESPIPILNEIQQFKTMNNPYDLGEIT